MTKSELKRIRLEPDNKKSRIEFLDETKVDSMHSRGKVYANPNWTIPEEDLLLASGVEYDEKAVIAILDEAGRQLGEPGSNERGVETQLALSLHKHLKDLPRKILFDNQFWYYLTIKSPAYSLHRYETGRKANGDRQGMDRLYGGWSRTANSVAYLAYYLSAEVGITEKQFERMGSRLRMWVIDESPLISQNLRRGFIEHVLMRTPQDSVLDSTWAKIPSTMGSLNLDLLTNSDVRKLFDQF